MTNIIFDCWILLDNSVYAVVILPSISKMFPSPWKNNTFRPIKNGRHFADHIFKWIFLNENWWILIKISLKCVPQINNIPLSWPMMVRLPTHICVTRPQRVSNKTFFVGFQFAFQRMYFIAMPSLFNIDCVARWPPIPTTLLGVVGNG